MTDHIVDLIVSLDPDITVHDPTTWTINGVPLSDHEKRMLADATDADWQRAAVLLATDVNLHHDHEQLMTARRNRSSDHDDDA
jgi:hypothetical protein